MEALFSTKLIRSVFFVSFVITASAYADEATKLGGGGSVPPKYPPTTYFNGGTNGDNAGRVTINPQVFDLYQIDPARNPIYFEGQQAVTQDAQGKEIRYQRVFQFLKVSPNSVGPEIRRGLLLPDTAYLDTPRVEWSPNQYTLGEMMLEVANERSKSFRRTLSIKGPVSATAKGAFELYLVAADGLDVYFEGKKDNQGRERVFRQTLNSAFIDRGYIEHMNTGHINWTEPNIPRGKALAEIAQTIIKEAPEGIRQALQKADAQPKIHDPKSGRKFPKYPEVQNAEKSPLPRGKSLVVTDGKTTEHSPYQRLNPTPSGSGQIDITSPYRGTFNPLVETYANEQWRAARPSNLPHLLEWSGAKSRRLGKAVHQYIEGGGPQKAAKVAGKATAELGRTSYNFYLAMGLLTAYEMSMNYPNNPRAWTAFLETGTDPVFYLSLGTFMAASEPFFRKMGPLNGPATTVMPRFTGALVVGGIASHIVSQILYDPNFRKCYPIADYALTYGATKTFERDLKACDQLYDKWANYQLDNELMPLIANLTASSGFFYTSLRAMKYLGTRTGVQNALGNVIRVFKVPPSAFARGNLQTVGLMAVFLGIYELNSEYLQVGGKVSEMFQKYNPDLQYPLRASYDLLTKGYVPSYINEYGNSLNDSEKRVLKEWKRIHEGKFKNPYVWKNVCLDTSRNFELLYNCDAPDQFMFDAVIKRYAEVQAAWREAKMKPTMDVFNSWSKKVYNYNSTIASSYVFYKALISLKTQAIKEGRPAHHMDEQTVVAMRTLMNSADMEADYREAWSYVMPRDHYDFIITSAACGPEAEPFGRTGTIGSIYNFFLAKSPTAMGADSMWSDIQFFPPRITQPQPGNKNICDKPNEGYDLLPTLMPGGTYRVESFPYDKAGPNQSWGSYLKREGYARGLDKYLMDNIRDSIIDEKGNDRFDEWWNEHVIVPHEKLQAEFRKEYEKMLVDRFVPALQDKSYFTAGGLMGWCEVNSAEYRVPSLEKHLRILGKGADCAPDATHRLAIGIFNSLEDELRLYSALMLDLNESISGQANNDLRDTLLAASELLQDLQTYLTTVDRKSRPDIKAIHARFAEIISVMNLHHEKLIEDRSEQWKKSSNSHIPLWNQALQEQFNSVFIQAAEYTKVLINFETSAASPQQ